MKLKINLKFNGVHMQAVIFFLIITAAITSFAQDSSKTFLYWKIESVNEYIPKLFSDNSSIAIGGNVIVYRSLLSQLNSDFGIRMYILPLSAGNKYEFSSLRTASLNITFLPKFVQELNARISLGSGYSYGQIINEKFYSLYVYSGTSFYLPIKKNFNLFTQVYYLHSFNYGYGSPVAKVGFKGEFLSFSFDLLNFINWSNRELRYFNILSVPSFN
jgi:hypothetical protein